MEVRHLEAFRAVIEHCSMTRAAAVLGVSQPAISGLIRRLEDEVGFSLFRRRHGQLEITPEAKLLHVEVCRALEGFDRIVSAARDIRRTGSGPLLVASHPSAGLSVLPRLGSSFLRERPGVTIRFLTQSSQLVKDMLPLQACDVGIAELPIGPAATDVRIFRFRCVCVLPAGHRLAERERLSPRDLSGEPLVSLFREHMTYRSVGHAFAEQGAERRIASEVEFFATACATVAAGGGFAIVDPLTAADFESRGIVVRPFEPTVIYAFAIFRPAHRVPSQLALEFIQAFIDYVSPFTEPEE